jgi:chromosome partitioning protein
MSRKPAQVIAVTIQKGGVGKTTTAAVLAQAGAFTGDKVLAVDLDPQANLTFCLRGDATGKNSYDLITGAADPAQTIQRTAQGVDLIPAAWNLATLDSYTGSAQRLKKALEPIRRKYRMIFIDAPAALGELQYNMIQAATGVIIPVETDTYNVQSLYQTIDTIRAAQVVNTALSFKGIILTRCDSRINVNKAFSLSLQDIASREAVPYLGSVRMAAKVKEAAGFQISLYDHAPKCTAAADYMTIYEKII